MGLCSNGGKVMGKDTQIIDGKEMSTVPMLPRTEVLSGKGTVWESILYELGWNELSEKNKVGYSTGSFLLPSGEEVTDVYFPALKTEVKNVFWDELKLGE